MRIAQIAPLMESVPPRFYGGTERVVSYLVEELVRQGHEVTLFASGDSRTSARLVPCVPKALRLDSLVQDYLPHVVLQLEQVRRAARQFDVLHFHIDYLHFPLFTELAGKTLTTLHGRLDLLDLQPLYRVFGDMPLVSISADQQRPLQGASWVGVVHHGLPSYVCPLTLCPTGDYLAFLGRISREKRPDLAIRIAQRAGVKLRIAAKVDRADEAYFRAEIEPLLAEPGVEYLGEISEQEKAQFLGNARALLFPIDWPEPFGLVMIESLSCGTPVIAFRSGSVPEVIDDGVTGYVVSSVEQAALAVDKVRGLDRLRVRKRFEERFSARRMTTDYVAIYQRLMTGTSRGALPGVRFA